MIYLDNAATSYPKPPSVYREMRHALRKYGGNPGRASHALASAAAEALLDCRDAASELFFCDAESVSLTFNATHALNIAIKGLMRESGNIMISDMEHNSVLRPVLSLCRNQGCSLTVYPSHGGDADKILNGIEDLIRPDTKLLVACHMSNVCPICLPIKEIGEICRDRGIAYVIDASQSAGHMPLKLGDIRADAVCVPGHKGLMGPPGTGLLITDGERLPETLLEGGSGIDSLDAEMPQFSPERFEAGTMPAYAAAVLASGIRYVTKTGTENILRKETELRELLYRNLSDVHGVRFYAPHGIGGTLMLNIDRLTPSEIGNKLNQSGICTRVGLHCAPLAHKTLGTGKNGAVRISIGHMNSRADILKLCDEIMKLADM